MRKYDGPRTHDDILQFVTHDYQYKKPMSMMSSPFGPMGYLRGKMVAVGGMIMEVHSWLSKMLRLSHVGAFVLLGSVGLVVALMFLIWAFIFAETKMKRD